MNRRRLFGSLLALLAAPAAFARRTLRLHGDGVHDDSEALQALINGERVRMPDGSYQQVYAGGTVFIPTGTYQINSSLSLPAGARFTYTSPFSGRFTGNTVINCRGASLGVPQ